MGSFRLAVLTYCIFTTNSISMNKN